MLVLERQREAHQTLPEETLFIIKAINPLQSHFTMTKEEKKRSIHLFKKCWYFLAKELHSMSKICFEHCSCSRSKQTINRDRTGKKSFLKINKLWIGHVSDKQDWHFQYVLARGGGGYNNMKTEDQRKRDKDLILSLHHCHKAGRHE